MLIPLIVIHDKSCVRLSMADAIESLTHATLGNLPLKVSHMTYHV